MREQQEQHRVNTFRKTFRFLPNVKVECIKVDPGECPTAGQALRVVFEEYASAVYTEQEENGGGEVKEVATSDDNGEMVLVTMKKGRR